mmetsp:Transcript_67265/g.152092  ORF Transcript_67265/g.152092 Transcript_67265/m.152092 type:complete len:255 (-) Transcript_67265:80-844(-)
MASGRDHHLRFNHLGVHAGLRVMVLCDQGPVRHDATNPYASVLLPDEEILNCHSIEELRVFCDERRTQHRRHEECSMLHNDVVALVVVRDLELIQQGVCGLADDHRAEELAAEPAAAAGCNVLLHNGHLDVWVLGQLVCAGEASRARTNDDDIGLGMVHHVSHVAGGHLATDDGLLDRLERHFVKVGELLLDVCGGVSRNDALGDGCQRGLCAHLGCGRGAHAAKGTLDEHLCFSNDEQKGSWEGLKAGSLRRC